MSGWVRVVSLGAGPAHWLTPEAHAALHSATDIIGYTPYVAAVPDSVTAKRHPSDNGVEVERASMALHMAANGARVAIVSGGDAGIFGMASAVFEALEQGDETWKQLDIEVLPGISAMLAAAARIGAPLGHDFCVISLSDYLKPWPVIEKRLRAASAGDFVLAIYNPASKMRREQLDAALACLRKDRAPETVVMVAKAVGREAETITITTLSALDATHIDMLTLLLIGSSHTRCIARPHNTAFVYTPRFYKATS